MLAVIEQTKNNVAWCKAVLIFLLGCILCPDNYGGMSLQYKRIVAHLGKVASYNWCKHVQQHLQTRTQGLKMPKVDMHFFLGSFVELNYFKF
ncbi:hypothetical protein LIER_38774 [Lithospermum erythrorhizon]|uniref:Uncharacterized protein n=1 Tax=Lithospermum erythrorhizon TaxID=34254 RepID=A0AAV3Q4K3_LITER